MRLRGLMRRLWSDAESAYRRNLLACLPAGDESLEALDVGCDDGAWTDVVRQTLAVPPAQVSGLEIVPERAELARARGFDVRTGDIDATWPFEDQSFDVVHANQVIEHVQRLDHFIEESKRVLRPGGRVVVCTENLASWHNVAALTLGYQPFSLTNVSDRRPVGNPLALHDEASELESWQHVHVLSLSGLRDLFTAHEFDVTKAWGAGYHPFPGRMASWLATHDPRHAHFIGVVAEPRTSSKIASIAAAVYVLLPFDIIPDFIPVVGHFDDAIIVTLALVCIKRGWFDRLAQRMRGRLLVGAPEV